MSPARPGGDRPLKVMQVLSTRVRSGVESHVMMISRGLRSRGVEVVLAPMTPSPFIDEARAEGFTVRSPRKQFFGDPRTFLRLARAAREEGVDLVHTHGEIASFYGRIAARLAGVRPIVTTVHSFTPQVLKDWCKSAPLRWFILTQDKWLARMVHKLILVTSELDEPMRAEGFAAEKLVVIPNLIDPQKCCADAREAIPVRTQFGIPETAIVFGFVGRLVPVKDPLLFVEFAQRLTARHADAHFLIVGDGPLRAEVEHAIASRGLQGRVHLAGWQTAVPRWLAAMDVLVVSSKSEGLCTSACEAMVLEKPVISNAVGGMGEIVRPGETGFLATNLDELVQAGAELCDQTTARELGQSARRFMLQFVAEQDVIGKLLAVYDAAVAAQRP